MTSFRSRNDTAILTLSILAVLVAVILSLATSSAKNRIESVAKENNPQIKAEAAAQAGINAGRWHIQCHGRIKAGSLSQRYSAGGATYVVEWDDVNLHDSTVNVRSKGMVELTKDQTYEIALHTNLKLTMLPSHKQDALDSYYSQNRPPVSSPAILLLSKP